MKTGQAWPGAIAFAVAVSLTMGMASAQGADPAGKPETGGVPEVSADAQISRHQDGQRDPNRGPVTNLPLPRYVSLKGSEGNARRGPSLSHRIDWVFRHAGMPLRVTAEFGHWRRVEDQDGAGGWVHYSLLSGVRTAIVHKDMLDLMAKPEARAASAVDPLGDLAKSRAAPASGPAAATADPFVYFVQAGAFRTPEDAESQRAKLGLIGVEAKITEREQSGRTVYRVRVGPFDSKDTADRAKERIDGGGIEATLVRVQR